MVRLVAQYLAVIVVWCFFSLHQYIQSVHKHIDTHMTRTHRTNWEWILANIPGKYHAVFSQWTHGSSGRKQPKLNWTKFSVTQTKMTFKVLQSAKHLHEFTKMSVCLKTSRDWPQIYCRVVQTELVCFCESDLSHSDTVFTANAAPWRSVVSSSSSAALHSATNTFEELQSGIMSSSDTRRPAQHSLPLTVCMYLFSVMSSVFIVAGSLALIIAGACWVR